MERAYILKTDGTVVKLNNDFTDIIVDIDGFLTSFKYLGTSYKFYKHSDFKEIHANVSGLINYFQELKFLKYIQFTGGETPTLDQLKNDYSFKFDKYLASVNTQVIVDTVDFNTDYNYYYVEKKIKFNVEFDTKNNTIKKYRDLRTFNLIAPSNSIIETFLNNKNSTPRGYFFKYNFGINIIDLTLTDEQLSYYSRLVTLMAFKIYHIQKDIFPKLISAQSMNNIDFLATTATLPNIDSLTLFEQIIFTLKKNWGNFYNPNNNSAIHTQFVPATLPIIPDEVSYNEYFNSLSNFYDQTYVIQDLLLDKSEDERLLYLLNLLSHSGITILPYNLRINLLKRFLKDSSSEKNEELILKIILSISTSEADEFLDFLLRTDDGKNTRFQLIYDFLDDKRLSRIPIVSWFVNEESNRMYFIKAIYELWKFSNYSLTLPNGEINNQSFFLTSPGEDYNYNSNGDFKESIFEFGKIKVSTPDTEFGAGFRIESIWADYTCDGALQGNFVIINKKVEHTFIYGSDSNGYMTANDHDYSEKEIKIVHHLYHSLILHGHSADEDLSEDFIPNNIPIPAFLFYYTNDYEKIKKLDAQYALGVEIGLEIVLFFTLGGGLSILRHLRHLKHVTKIHRAISGTLSANETVLVWRGLQAGSEVISLKASLFMSLANYNATIAPEGPEKERQKKISSIFMWITLAFAGGSIIFSKKAGRAAEDLIDEIESLPSGTPHNVPTEILEVMYAVKGEKVVAQTLFHNTLNTLFEPQVVNNIITKYNQFSDSLKTAFFNDFKGAPKSFWIELNQSGTYMDNWKNLFLKSVEERKIIDFIKNQDKVDVIIQFYNVNALKNVLLPLTVKKRGRFIKEMINISTDNFNKFVDDHELINHWYTYYDDLLLRNDFKNLGVDEMIKWCEDYKTLPQNLIDEIKSKPLTFKNWGDLSEADRLLLKNIPDEWIPSVYQFDDFCLIRKFCPVEIPNFAIDLPKQKTSYKQVTFEWLDDLGFTWEARAHQPIPETPFFNNGQVWIINTRIKGAINSSTRSFNDVYIGNGEFVVYQNSPGSWRSLTTKQRAGITLTNEESNILARGHFKAK